MARMASSASVRARRKKTLPTRLSPRPARSSASMVLAKVGFPFASAMASISAMLSANTRSNAGRKCPARMRSNGGISKGVVHGASRGFLEAVAAVRTRAPFTVFGAFGLFGVLEARAGAPLPFAVFARLGAAFLPVIRHILVWLRVRRGAMPPVRGKVETQLHGAGSDPGDLRQ